jgi:peroxiredoxin
MNQQVMKLTMAAVALSCTFTVHAQQKVTIEGKLAESVNGIVVLAYKGPDDRLEVNDTVTVKNGQFIIKKQLQEPTYGRLELNPEVKTVGMPSGKTPDYTEFFMEPLTIKITGTENLHDATVKGGPADNDFKAVMREFGAIGKRGQELSDLQIKYQAEGNEDGVNEVRDEVKSLMLKKKTVQADFIRSHPDSYVALTLWMRKLTRTVIRLPETEQEFNSFSARIRQSPSGKLVAQRIAAAKKLAVGETALDFTLPDAEDKRVSLSSFKGKNVVLCFWQKDFNPFDVFVFALTDMKRQLKDQHIEVVTVYYNLNNSTKEDWKTLLTANNMQKWVNLIDENGLSADGATANSTVARAYDLAAVLPQFYLLDTNGKVLIRDLNPVDNPVAKIKAALNK